MKKSIALFAALLAMSTVCSAANNNQQQTNILTVPVYIDNKEIEFDGTAAQIKDNTTYVPVRGVFESLGYTVSWDSETRTVTLSKDNINMMLTVDNAEILIVNSDTDTESRKKINNAPIIIDNRAMLPLRAVAETSGYVVDWDATARTVTINSQKTEAENTENNSELNVTNPSSQLNYNVEMKTETFEEKATDGTVIFTASVTYPQITGANSEAVYKLNNLFKTAADEFIESPQNAEYIDSANEHYKFNSSDNIAFNEYSSLKTYVLEYMDDDIISFAVENSVYLGGAHPSPLLQGETYSLETGEKLAVTDILGISEEEAKKIMVDGFNKEIEKNPDNFFEEDMRENLNSANIENFYVTEEGIAFFFNRYEIAPYAAGEPTYIYKYK